MKQGRDYFDGVILADLHSGSNDAPQPPSFTLKSGIPITPNTVGLGLNRALNTVIEKWKHPNILILLGDMVNGSGLRFRGGVSGNWSSNPIDQLKAASYWINKFEAEKIAVLRGTTAHVLVEELPAEEYLIEHILPKEKAVAVGAGDYISGIKFILNKWDIRLHFAHHSQTSQSDWFLATPIQKEGIRLRLKMKEIGDVQAVFRGHNHYFAKVEFGSQILVNCPAWQLPTEWLHRKSGEPLTDIGAIRFRIFREPDDMEKRLRIQKMLFKIPEGVTREVRL